MGIGPLRSHHVHPCTCGQQTWLGSAPDITAAVNYCAGARTSLAGFPLLSLPLGTSWHPVFFSISAKPRRCMLLKCSQGVGWRAGLVLSALWDAAPRPCPGSGGQGWRGAGGRRRHLRRGSLRVWSPAGRTRVLRAAALLWAPAGPPLLPSACQLGPNLISVLSVRTPLKLNSAYYQQLPCHRRTLPLKAALAR